MEFIILATVIIYCVIRIQLTIAFFLFFPWLAAYFYKKCDAQPWSDTFFIKKTDRKPDQPL